MKVSFGFQWKQQIAIRFFFDICESKCENMLEMLAFQLYREQVTKMDWAFYK